MILLNLFVKYRRTILHRNIVLVFYFALVKDYRIVLTIFQISFGKSLRHMNASASYSSLHTKIVKRKEINILIITIKMKTMDSATLSQTFNYTF